MLKISTGMTKYERCGFSRLKKLFQTNINFRTYDEFVPAAKNHIVGNLPSEMIQYIVKTFPDTKAQMIKKFQKGLGVTAVFARGQCNRFKREGIIRVGLDELSAPNMEALQRQMSNIFHSNIKEILPANSSVQFKFLDRGATGNAFKLSLLNEQGQKLMPDTAFKVYHKRNSVMPEAHGNYAEANIATFFKRVLGHNMENSPFAKHYMSDMKNGYSLSEFLYTDGDYEFKFINYAKMFGVHSIDALKSFIGGKIFDLGGFQKLWNFTEDKVTLRYYKKLMNNPKIADELLERFEILAENPKTPHREKILDAIELYLRQSFVQSDEINESLKIWELLSDH